ncbi:PEP-CTERM sorting domain-containing protein [Betaproteobacteria bacterium SCN1]|jgi:hypothetical protein|nr:PEP-CTERM sorting domain-containing protein [Betaproteobacteria bacterium SCN1]MBN8759262.1 PEP-CTERM sorting domain-containing protein [Thiobacillus sp.]
MTLRSSIAALSAAGLLAMPSAHALVIEFDYTYDTKGFFTDLETGAPIVERRSLLEEAASFYSGFTDSLSAIAPQAGDSWSVRITHPSLGPTVTLTDLTLAADTLRIYVGGSESAPGVLGFARLGSNLTASGSDEFVDAVTTRGQTNTTGVNATDYGTWGGSIWFNAANAWYFGSDPAGLTPGHPDFLTTAIHEIGHILGFGEADAWYARINDDGYFTGAHSVAAYGDPVPVDQYGAHWASGTMSTYAGLPQQTLMDPSTRSGTRELPTVLDYAGFADIGWQVSAVPEPQHAALFGLGALTVIAAARRRRKPA